MADLSADSATEVVATCKAAAGEVGEAFGRALEGSFQLEVDTATNLAQAGLPEGCDGPGLILILRCGEAAAAVVVPAVSGLLPDWCAAPGPTEKSRLETLAQELGVLLLPDSVATDGAAVVWVEGLAEAVERGRPATDAATVPLTVRTETGQAVLGLLWPLADPKAIQASVASAAAVTGMETQDATEADTPTASGSGPSPTATEPPKAAAAAADDPLARLPVYVRSLLRIRVPVQVRLASKRQPIGQIVDLCAGSIITFAKTCDEVLELKAGGCNIAVGEAVKVGDKFGLRISSMTMPSERFQSVRVNEQRP